MVCASLNKDVFKVAKRPKKRPKRPDLSPEERRELAARASYEGSPEHKVELWWHGLPEARQLPGGRVGRRRKQTTTICTLTTEEDRVRATEWVRQAIANGQYRYYEGDKDFPRRIRHRADGRIWYGVCLNQGQGHYKGWPIEEDEQRAIFG